MMIRLWLSRLVLPGLAVCLAAFAVLISLIRFWVVPELPRYRPQLETTIGALLGEQISIGALSAELDGLDPALMARDVCVLDSNNTQVLCLARIEIHLNTLRTLLTSQPAISQLRITGTDLTLVRDLSGHIGISGLKPAASTPAWMLAIRRISVVNAHLHWLDQTVGSTALDLGSVTAGLVLRDQTHVMSLDATLAATLGQRVSGQIQWSANGQTGQFHLELDQLRLDTLAGFWPGLPIRVRAGALNGTLAGDWNGPHHQALRGDLHLGDTVLSRLDPSATPVGFSLPGARFSLNHDTQDWHLSVSRFQPKMQTLWPESQAEARFSLNEAGLPGRLSLSADYLDIADVAGLIRELASDTAWSQYSSSLNPKGRLRQLRAYYDPAASLGQRWGGQVEVEALSLTAFDKIPGIQGAHLSLNGNDHSGQMNWSVESGHIDLPRVGFRRGLPLDHLTSRLSWLNNGTDWHIDVPDLHFEQGRFHGALNMNLTLPGQADESPQIALNAQVFEADETTVLDLMPRGVIPLTASWFDKALSRGIVHRADVVLQGPLRQFPFRHEEGKFEVSFDAEDVELLFHPEWLPLTGLNAKVRFIGPSLEIESKRGRIGQAQLSEVSARVDDLNIQPWLELHGQATGRLTEAFEVLSHSPIQRIPAQLDRLLSVSGNTQVELNLKVPLDHRLGQTEVQGTAHFNHAGLQFRDLGLNVDQIEGPLNFTRERLSAQGIRGRFLSRPVGVKVNQDNNNIFIDVDGSADAQALSQLFTTLGRGGHALVPPALWSRVKGAMEYRLHLDIPESLGARNEDFKLKLQSSLQGMALDWPKPLGKSEKSALPLAVDLTLRPGSDAPLSINLDNALQARLRFSELSKGFAWKGGTVAVGRSVPDTRPTTGLTVLARVDDLELSEWLPAWGLVANSSRSEAETTALDTLELDINRLAFQQQALGDLHLSLRQDNGLYSGDISGNLAQGRFSAGRDRVRVALDHVRWPQLNPRTERHDSTPTETCTDCATTADWPALDINVAKMFWHNVELGQLHLNTQTMPGRIKLQNLQLDAPDRKLSLEGEWSTLGSHPRSHIKGQLHLDGLGQTLAHFGFPGKLRDTPARFELDLAWPGGPQHATLTRLVGQIGVDLGKGGIPDIDPGLGRVLGLLNLDTIWRRLSFDFSDLFGAGLAYDGIKGNLRLDNGQVLTEGLLIDAVPARILISGRAGLQQHDLDQTVTVIPHTTAALPIAGVLAGGPAVGAAVLVAQQLIGDHVDSITASQYSLKGTWQNPRIDKLPDAPPLEWLNKAWSGFKAFSGLTPSPITTKQE